MSEYDCYYLNEKVKLQIDSANNNAYKKVERIMKSCQMNQKQFAERVGISPTLVSKWKSGEKEITLPQIEVIAREFEIDMNYFIKGSTDYYVAPVQKCRIEDGKFYVPPSKKLGPRVAPTLIVLKRDIPNNNVYLLQDGLNDAVIIERIMAVDESLSDINEPDYYVIDSEGNLNRNCEYESTVGNIYYFTNKHGKSISVPVSLCKNRVAIYIDDPLKVKRDYCLGR
ncbi:MAG: helix-turn-helix domain-containing protein [Massilimicrobiota timonensis]